MGTHLTLLWLLLKVSLSHSVLKPPEVFIKTKEMSVGKAPEYN